MEPVSRPALPLEMGLAVVRVGDSSEPLNAASKVLAEELSQRLPEWRDFAEVHRGEAHDDWEPGSLTVELPSTTANRATGR
jgi:hypothetical protein